MNRGSADFQPKYFKRYQLFFFFYKHIPEHIRGNHKLGNLLKFTVRDFWVEKNSSLASSDGRRLSKKLGGDLKRQFSGQKYSLSKYENLSLNPHHPCKKVRHGYMYLPSQHQDRNRKVTLAKMASFQFSEKACLKEIMKRSREEDTQYSLWPPHVCTWHTYLHTHMHAPRIHEK